MATASEDGFGIELREIGKTDLLTPDQEVELAERIKRGDPEARSHMIRANLRLVVKIAQDYANYGLPLLDLISEGNIGLMKAVERFDPNKGGKLSTYAAWWIKQSIKRALANQSKTIRLPVHMVDKIGKMRRVAMAMFEELGREPTDDELSEEIGIDRAKLSQLKAASIRPASLDAPISHDDSTTFRKIVADENAQNPFELLSQKNMHSQLDGLLTVLDERERKIIEARFGLAGQKPRTLEEVGQEFGVTRERIRQLQNIALRKLRRALQKKEDPIPKTLRVSKPLVDLELDIEQQERFASLALKRSESVLTFDEKSEFERLRQAIRIRRNLIAPLPLHELELLKMSLQQEINQNANQEPFFELVQLRERTPSTETRADRL
ncbi:MAG: RNA polymerase sigma factor RpoD/SigA [Verrucomicrobiaceae bacterium]